MIATFLFWVAMFWLLGGPVIMILDFFTGGFLFESEDRQISVGDVLLCMLTGGIIVFVVYIYFAFNPTIKKLQNLFCRFAKITIFTRKAKQ